LFIFFINDLSNINIDRNKEFISFADDTAILISELTIDKLYHEANNIINDVYIWFCKNKLKLNLLKSKFICFNLSVNNDLHVHNLIVHSLKCNTNLSKCNRKVV